MKEVTPSRDRAASPENMNKLKDLIEEKKIENKSEEKQDDKDNNKNKIKEVPEDILRKILE